MVRTRYRVNQTKLPERVKFSARVTMYRCARIPWHDPINAVWSVVFALKTQRLSTRKRSPDNLTSCSIIQCKSGKLLRLTKPNFTRTQLMDEDRGSNTTVRSDVIRSVQTIQRSSTKYLGEFSHGSSPGTDRAWR